MIFCTMTDPENPPVETDRDAELLTIISQLLLVFRGEPFNSQRRVVVENARRAIAEHKRALEYEETARRG